MADPRVFNKRSRAIPPDAVYVGRPTIYGNPFPMDGEAERNMVCDRYEAWIKTQPELLKAVRERLRGKNLVCWCAPKRCHADILLRIANEDTPHV